MIGAAWRSTALFLSVFALATATLRAESPSPDSRPVAARPISFEENRGQTDPRVKFVSRGADYWLLLATDEAILVPRGSEGESVHIRVKGAAQEAAIAGVERLPGKVYYATGESKGRSPPPPHSAESIHRRVSRDHLEYYGRDRQLEFDFTVAPHADPRQIRLEFAGADRISVGENGELRLRWDPRIFS